MYKTKIRFDYRTRSVSRVAVRSGARRSALPFVQPVPYDRRGQHVRAQEKEAYVKELGIDVHVLELHFLEKLGRVFVVTVHVVRARQHVPGEAVQRVHDALERRPDETEVVKPHVQGGYVREPYRETEHGQQHYGDRPDEHGHLQRTAIGLSGFGVFSSEKTKKQNRKSFGEVIRSSEFRGIPVKVGRRHIFFVTP